MSWIVGGLLASAAVLVVSVHGLASLLALWNFLPVILGTVVWVRSGRGGAPGEARRSGRERLASGGFAALAGLLVALVHLAWHLDWAGTATAGSTSGLIFLLAPLLALAGSLAWMAAVALVAMGRPTRNQ